MPIQSYLMMYFAGSGWQYGKRKISAMSNEQFNKLSPEELLMQHSIELKNMLPTLTKTLNDVTPLVRELILQYGDFVKEAIAVLPVVAQNLFGGGGTLEGTDIKTSFTPSWWQGSALLYAQYQLSQGVEKQKLRDAFVNKEEEAKVLPNQSTIKGLTVSQAQQQARDKQIAFERQQVLAKEAHARLVVGKTITTPIPQIQPRQTSNLVTKRRAGQSQILERTKLIRQIAQLGQWIKTSKGPQGLPLTISQRSNFTRDMRNNQQLLVNLLARYRFQ